MSGCARFTRNAKRPSPPPVMRQIEKIVLLQTLDALWKDHLLAMDHLKEGIGLRGYAQQNPLVEYQKEGFAMFELMMGVMQQDVVEKIFSVQVTRQQEVEQIEQRQPAADGDEPRRASAKRSAPPRSSAKATRSGRNDPCPCGSGKKYKRCHGK